MLPDIQPTGLSNQFISIAHNNYGYFLVHRRLWGLWPAYLTIPNGSSAKVVYVCGGWCGVNISRIPRAVEGVGVYQQFMDNCNECLYQKDD
jgi:hypothetical protein